MKQQYQEVTIGTTAKLDVVDLTGQATDFASGSGIQSGIFTATVAGSTASITTIEYESGVIQDLKRAIEELVPSGRPYAHDSRWGDGNGYSHVRAALLKPSLTIPIRNGDIMLGTWQQLVLLDFDNRPRRRKVVFHVMGE